MTRISPDDDEPISVADPQLRKTRVLSEQCGTCVFRAGNPMRLAPGRLAELVDQARADDGYIVCHDTLPYGAHPGYGPAVCRGFYDRYDTQSLQIARRMWGILEVPPPSTPDTPVGPDQTPGQDTTRTAETGTTPPNSTPMRPVVFVDVDGVLNPAGSRQRAYEYQPHHFDGLAPDGEPASGTVWLHPDHGPWLAEIEAAGAQMVWATSWGQLANTWIAPRLHLPGTWPALDLGGYSAVRWGRSGKLVPISSYAAARPFAWIDDEFGGKDPHWARERTSQGLPTLLCAVDPYRGLTRAEIDTVLDWLGQMPTAPA